MNHPTVVTLVLRLLVGCYGYMMVMASANVASCEWRRPGQCGNQWTQAFTWPLWLPGSVRGTVRGAIEVRRVRLAASGRS